MGANNVKNWGLAVAAAVVGAAAGVFLFKWAFSQGFYALIIPGACTGWATGYFGQHRDTTRGAFAALLALAVSLYAEWDVRPFIADESLTYFLTHVHQLEIFTMLMLALGSYLAYSMGAGRNKGTLTKS